MNLIEKFENMPFQDVGTFNSIFKNSPIIGVSFNSPVEIKELVAGKRRIIAGDSEFYLDLSQKTVIKQEKKASIQIISSKIKKVSTRKKLNLSRIYKMLKPTEFMIYMAIKEAGEIDGVEEFSRNVGLSNKTIAANIKRLVELKLVKIEYVASEEGSFNKITIDTTTTI